MRLSVFSAVAVIGLLGWYVAIRLAFALTDWMHSWLS